MHESTFEAKLLLDTRSVLGEGPVWDWQRQTLYWVDIEGKYLHQLVLETNEHYFWQLPSMAGAAIPEITGNILLALEDGLASFQVANKDFRKHGILKNEDSKMRYNDGKVGPNGDFYIGSMHKEFDPESGNLYKVTSKGQVSVAIPNTTISNGMAWTADKKTFYFSDTENYRIDRYDFDIDSGNLKNRKTAFNIPKELGGADGMCIDSEDMLWIAHWGGACIRQWNPRTGEIIQKIEVAAPHVTSCCFGGKNLDTLYITTARSGLSEEQLEKYPQSGGLFTFKPGVTGALITYFKEL